MDSRVSLILDGPDGSAIHRLQCFRCEGKGYRGARRCIVCEGSGVTHPRRDCSCEPCDRERTAEEEASL